MNGESGSRPLPLLPAMRRSFVLSALYGEEEMKNGLTNMQARAMTNDRAGCGGGNDSVDRDNNICFPMGRKNALRANFLRQGGAKPQGKWFANMPKRQSVASILIRKWATFLLPNCRRVNTVALRTPLLK